MTTVILRAIIFCVALFIATSIQAAQNFASALVCNTSISPKTEMAPFTDEKITTRLWRDRITACGDTLIADWWLYDGKHWSLSLRRDVKNYIAPRKAPVQLVAQLSVNGKAVNGPHGAINARMYEFQIAYMEAYRIAPRLSVRDLIAKRKIPPINMFREPIQTVFVTGHRDVKDYFSLGDGPLARGMPGAGERADLGLVGEWCASYISYWDIAGDYWWKACTDQAYDTANIPWTLSGPDGRAIMWDDPVFKNKGFDPRNPPGTIVALPPALHYRAEKNPGGKWVQTKAEDGWQIDDSHQPFVLLVPYMSTRHPYFLWLAQFQTGSLYGYYECGFDWCERRKTTVPTLMGAQIRGTAWSFRTLTQTSLMTPDNPPAWLWPKARYQPFIVASEKRWRETLIVKSRNYWLALKENRAGKLKSVEGCGVVKATGRISCGIQMWMYDFWGQGLGFAKWAGVQGIDPMYKLLNDILVYRYEKGSAVRNLGAPFTMVFSNPKGSVDQLANSREDVRRFTPSENLTYGSGKPLIVGSADNLGQWSELGWHAQGNAAFCALNGDARCADIARWWQAQFEAKKAANPQWYGGWELGKYRIALE